MIVLIPSYEPAAHLVPLIRQVRERAPGMEIVVVDDGSGPGYAPVFADAVDAGATLVSHPRNRGKGAALKTGFRFVLEQRPGEDVITADADGQHTPADILRIAGELAAFSPSGTGPLVLGVRRFGRDVPLRSRFGNAVARGLFRLSAGWRSTDTQTGLRGIPASMLPWMADVPGERFEYEMEVLLRLARSGHAARELPIETVYLEHNASSHFRPVTDSVRVLLPVVKFAGSSLLAFAIDTVALLVLSALLGSATGVTLVIAVVGARLISASANFAVNRRFVFGSRDRPGARRQGMRYAMLAALLLASNVVWMEALTSVGTPLLLAKVVTETVLFITSYQLQRRVVFTDESSARTSGSQDRETDEGVAREHAQQGEQPVDVLHPHVPGAPREVTVRG